MADLLVVFAGCPSTGKSFVINKLLDVYVDLRDISIDKIEENLYDKYGFNNLLEKKKLYDLSFDKFYQSLENNLKNHYFTVIDYPFSYLQRDKILSLVKKYNYTVITIRFVSDMHKLYQKRVIRDMDESRHLGHILDVYHKGIKISKEKRREYIISEQEFINHCILRKYNEFYLGELLEIDVTNNYADMKDICNFINTFR